MPNPHRAEIELEALGQRFKCRLDIDAICNAEAELDMGFGDIMARVLQRGANMRIARALIYNASMAQFDGSKGSQALDRDQVNAMLDFENLVKVWPQVVRLVALCLPPSQEGGDANPPVVGAAIEAVPGTGSDS